MSVAGFLLDEHVSRVLYRLLAEADLTMQVYMIGDGLAPPKTTSDPDLLLWIEERDVMLLTNNRASMPVHLTAHLLGGHHLPGIIQLPADPDLDEVVADLLLIRGASLPDEFSDRITYLPLR
jgi:hypothetical protein